MEFMASPAVARPEATEYPAGVANYIQLVPAGDLVAILADQAIDLNGLLSDLSDAQALVHHAPYTWSIKQVIGHMADCERVFGYRAMRLARNDVTPLPGFDENAYVASVDFDRYPFGDLLAEFELLRHSHHLMLSQLSPEAWLRKGVINNHPMTTRDVACVMAGHAQHHLNFWRTRLGV